MHRSHVLACAILASVLCPPALAGGAFQRSADMATPRASYGAALLPDGRVLFTGGIADFGVHLIQAELYDPATDAFVPTGSMTEIRMRPTVAALADGRVLVLGGRGGATGDALATAELYDPATGQFSVTGAMAGPRYVASATLLEDGRVLVAGGLTARDVLATAELYDPVTGTFSATGSLVEARIQPLAVRLADGRVLMAGGSDGGYNGGFPIYYPDAAVYDPASGAFTPAGTLAHARELQAAARMPDGRVLVAGGAHLAGEPGSVTVPIAEAWDPATASFEEVGPMAVPRYESTPVALADGSILFAGGWAFAGDTVGDLPTAAAERFVPDVADAIFDDGFEGAVR